MIDYTEAIENTFSAFKVDAAKRTTMEDKVTGDGLCFVTTVHRPAMPDLHLGFAFQHQAEQACRSLVNDLTSTTHVPGTMISWSRRPSGITVIPPVPTDAHGLTGLVKQESYSGDPDQFPDLYSRLAAQEGHESAGRLWSAVCYLLDHDETAVR